MNTQWSDSMKWKMELLKSGITFTIAALISLFVIDYIQDQRVQKKAKADAAYSARLKALDDFRSATVNYDTAAEAAFAALFEWSGREKTAAMIRYEQDAYPKWLSAIETTSHMYPREASEIEKLVLMSTKRHGIYDGLVDQRLDSKDPSKPIDPWAVRTAFHSSSRDLTALRAQIIKSLQSDVFPSPAQ